MGGWERRERGETGGLEMRKGESGSGRGRDEGWEGDKRWNEGVDGR